MSVIVCKLFIASTCGNFQLAHSGVLGSLGNEENEAVPDHVPVVGPEGPQHSKQFAAAYSTVKQPRPPAQYEKSNSHSSNAQSSPQAKKDSVVYAELGSRPANAPPVLPPNTRVQYTTMKKEPLISKDTVSVTL